MNLHGCYLYYTHFTDVEREAQRSYMPCEKSLDSSIADPEFEPKLIYSKSHVCSVMFSTLHWKGHFLDGDRRRNLLSPVFEFYQRNNCSTRAKQLMEPLLFILALGSPH